MATESALKGVKSLYLSRSRLSQRRSTTHRTRSRWVSDSSRAMMWAGLIAGLAILGGILLLVWCG